MSLKPELITVDGADGPLGALRWAGIDGAPTVIAVHGITANAWHFDTVAHHLAGAAHLIAVDLRGRGRSVDHPGPFGIRQHAADVAQIIDSIGGPLTIVGHSMGAYVALMTAETHPSLVHQLVLVDGGTPLPCDETVAIDDTLRTTLGPALDRLRRVWPDRVSYETMWSNHPAFDGAMSVNLERTLIADLVEVDGGFGAAVNETTVLTDGRDLFADTEVRSLLALQDQPATILRAPRGLDGAPPALIPESAITEFDQHDWRTIDDTNHYTVLLGPTGAAATADAIRRAAAC